jgi:glycosyltransferase involved in cell wall biosynthesis
MTFLAPVFGDGPIIEDGPVADSSPPAVGEIARSNRVTSHIRSARVATFSDERLEREPAIGAVEPVLGSSLMQAVRVSVVIPTLNEEENLPALFARLHPDIAEIILVDGHSVDNTVEEARRLCPEAVILTQDGKGKGNALACGFAAATGDVIVMLDADGSTDPREIPRFVAALLTGADFAKGTRFVTGGGSDDITMVRRLGNRVLSGTVNLLWKCHYSDLCYGYNAFWRRHLRLVTPDCSGFEVETLINIRVARSSLKVVEVPSFESCRVHGQSNLNARRDGVRVLRTILAERVRPA